MLGDMDAFQWVFYDGDRPAMEMVGAAILQGFFSRYPNVRLLLSASAAWWRRSPRSTWTASPRWWAPTRSCSAPTSHGEGRPHPSAYLGQLKNLSEEQVYALMRGNMGRFLGLDV